MTKQQILETVAKNVKACKKCRLCEEALNAVPGEGDINAEIIFVGEAPGANEDKTGRPFVGRAGQLLENLLGEIGLTRNQVWIGNIIKHRPPNNRDPLPDEIEACQPYLKMQLEALQPKVIVTLGRFAMNYFYPAGKITRDRGSLKKIGGYYIYPVYHPAAALRNGDFADALKRDFLKIPKVLEFIEKNENLKGEENAAQTTSGTDEDASKKDPQLEMF